MRWAGAGARPASAARGRIKTVIVVSIVAFPAMTLMLAKQFQNDMLGWVFGLTLIAGAALLPCAAVFYLGLQIGSRTARGGTPTDEAVVNMVVHIDRTSVHASDDAPSSRISVAPHTTLRAPVAPGRPVGLSRLQLPLPTGSGRRRGGTWRRGLKPDLPRPPCATSSRIQLLLPCLPSPFAPTP